MAEQKVIDGISFSASAPEKVCAVLLKYLNKPHYIKSDRLRLFYGDTATGECWMEEFDTMGYIGFSIGPQKIPLLIKTRRSKGGCGILDSCIVRIQCGKDVLYQHPTFYFKETHTSGCQVFVDGELYADCATDTAAVCLADFLLGRRNAA